MNIEHTTHTRNTAQIIQRGGTLRIYAAHHTHTRRTHTPHKEGAWCICARHITHTRCTHTWEDNIPHTHGELTLGVTLSWSIWGTQIIENDYCQNDRQNSIHCSVHTANQI